MSKDKGKKKDKKKAVTAEPTLSKKEAKKLKKREAELAAELERRAEKKAKKKGGKKGKNLKAAFPDAEIQERKLSKAERAAIDAAAEARAAKRAAAVKGAADAAEGMAGIAEAAKGSVPAATKPKKKGKSSKERGAVIDPETGETRPEVIAERKAKAAAEAEKIDAEISARLKVKKAARKEGKAAVVKDAENVDRADHEAVMAYNLRAVAVGATLLTSDQERAEISAKTETPNQAVEVVETDRGREFQVGESVNADPAEEFAKPSDAEPFLESGKNGYKIIQLDAEGNPDPKVIRQYTRVTTYVGNIDDETSLREWKERLLAEGIAANAEEFLPRISDLVHRRNVTVAKAERKDAKGRLGLGELAVLVNAANKEYKTSMNALVKEALDAAGASDKADAGTHLHTLAEIVDAKGIDPIREMHEQTQLGESPAHLVTANDLASMEAYEDAMRRMETEHIVSEAVIVNDALRHAGRLDAIKFAKLPALVDPKSGEVVRPADGRRRRYVFDVKSGKIDYAAGKISRQLAAYAHGDLYDLETGTRTPHGAAKDVAIVVHLPLGTGECHVYAVDLKEGYRLLKLSESVRAGRSSGRKAINTAVDLAAPAAKEED